MRNYVAYICNTFFLPFDYVPYPKSSLKSMTNDISSQKQLCLKNFNILINYVSIYLLRTASKDQNW